jgi:predicted glycosyltransferase
VAQDYVPAGVRLLRLPPQVRIPTDGRESEVRVLQAERKRLTVERRSLLLEYAREWRPDILLVDHLPLGKREELDRTIAFLHKAGKTVLLGYRRIMEDRDSTARIFTYAPFRSALLTSFRAILVYAPPWVEVAHGPLTDVPLRQIHVGFVCRREACSKAAARRHFGLRRDGKVVACCLGGGRDTWPLARAILEGWRRVQPANAHLLFFAGPHLSAPEHELQSYAAEDSVSIVRNSPHFPRGIAAADAVLSTGGYNSILETLVQGRPLWAIPYQRSECEQQNSVSYFEKLGLVKQVQQREGLEPALRRTFRDIFDTLAADRPRPRLQSTWFLGGANTARWLRHYAEEENLNPAQDPLR